MPIGTPCPIDAPTVPANEDLINSSADCQRVALLNFYSDNFGMDEGQPVKHPSETVATLLKTDWNINDRNTLSVSWNFNHSKKENETFDVASYGTSANGIEGNPARINVLNANLYSTISTNRFNELHFTYSREDRPRAATDSNLAADTGIGFAPSFRFGNPFFLQPAVDELFWRTQIRDTFTVVKGNHTIKVGGEWIHSLNDQVFRGFFTGRYLFDSVSGFLRYASPAAAGGFGPGTVGCSDGGYVTHPDPCPGGATTGGPLLFFLHNAGTGKPDVAAPGASTISNDEFGVFLQDTWKVTPNFTLNYGLRWDAQPWPRPSTPRERSTPQFIGDARFPSDGTIPDQWDMWQPRVGFAWDVTGDAKTVLRGNCGPLQPPPEHAEPGGRR